MNVQIVNSDYSNMNQVKDLPDQFAKDINPIYIAARHGQKIRALKKIKEKRLDGFVVGLWELEKYGLLTYKGFVNPKLWTQHDTIYVNDPTRVSEKYRKTYETFLDCLRKM